ncbi:MAG: hypothetical protein JSW11_00470 [Candidatus Heimdallarchaeota archaeon]|nr:MAG: hypothetical protein JSW11_00470 [Candidatus Heimdallarchaeota archaeon]
MKHNEILIKVNAWVDEKVASLVESINCFEDLLTLASCEGDDENPAYVYFTSVNGPFKLFDRVHMLSIAAGQAIKADDEFRFQIEWTAGSEEPMATLYVRRKFLKLLTQVIKGVAVADRFTIEANLPIMGRAD